MLLRYDNTFLTLSKISLPSHFHSQIIRRVNVFQPKTKAGLLSLRMFAEAMKMTAIYDKYEANEYLMGAGLSVTPEYRGLGIAGELLKTRFVSYHKPYE